MDFNGLTSASHVSLSEAGYGSEEGQTLYLILKTAAAKESRLILELVRFLVNTGKTTSGKSGIRSSCTAKIGYWRRQAIEAV